MNDGIATIEKNKILSRLTPEEKRRYDAELEAFWKRCRHQRRSVRANFSYYSVILAYKVAGRNAPQAYVKNGQGRTKHSKRTTRYIKRAKAAKAATQ